MISSNSARVRVKRGHGFHAGAWPARLQGQCGLPGLHRHRPGTSTPHYGAGAAIGVCLATLPDDGPNGGFFDDNDVVAW